MKAESNNQGILDGSDSERVGVDDRRLVVLPEDGPTPEIPDDEYEAIYNMVPDRMSAPDSMAMGHYVWRRVFVGFRGKVTGVMLSPEWADALEF